MQRVRLIHWKLEEAAERAKRIGEYKVDYHMPAGSAFLRQLSNNPPAAIVIDLSRLPSQGRDLALSIRRRKSTRYIPLVFVEGDPKKVDRVRELLPDAVYTGWEQISAALEQAITNPPTEPVAPDSQFAAYAGRSLVQKLGIKANTIVALLNAPPDFPQTLGSLPEGVSLPNKFSAECDLVIWFVHSVADLDDKVGAMAHQLGDARLWIAWPKKASKMASDVSQQQVREAGLAAGLVDYKICSIDKTWSGLLFTRRKSE